MSQEPGKSTAERPRSVTENRDTISKTSSRLDPVKRGLGIIILLSICLTILVEKSIDNIIWQLMIYLFFGLSAVAWVSIRVRQVINQTDQEN